MQSEFFRSMACLICLVLLQATTHGADAPSVPKTAALLESGERPVKVVVIGDSITGVYYHTGGRRAWPEMLAIALQRAYPKGQPVVVNAGISGDSTAGALHRFDRDVLRHKPDLVVIMFGMNDLVRIPEKDFGDNLKKLIDRTRAAGAEVVLCTQNDVYENTTRPNARLDLYEEIIRQTGQAEKVPVADCHAAYDALRLRDEAAWKMLMSDAIHPNMSGHKLFAEVVARTISGKEVSLADVAPPSPVIPKTLKRLAAGEPIKVLAMPPYDAWTASALRALDPQAKVEMQPWPTADLTAAQLMQSVDKVRSMKFDLIVIAIPPSIVPENLEQYRPLYTRLMNFSLSFGYQEWDVLVLPPSIASASLKPEELAHDQFARQLIAAQDLGTVTRPAGDKTTGEELLTKWFAEQRKLLNVKPE